LTENPVVPFKEQWGRIRKDVERLFSRFGREILVSEPAPERMDDSGIWGDLGDDDSYNPADSLWGDLGDDDIEGSVGGEAFEWLIAVPVRDEFKIDHGLRLGEPAIGVLADKAPMWLNVGAYCSWGGKVFKVTRVVPWGFLPDERSVFSVLALEEVYDGSGE